MSLRKALEVVRAQLEAVVAAVSELQVHLKDEPPDGAAVTDPFAYGADDVYGLLAEAQATVQAVIDPSRQTDTERTAVALAAAHTLVLEVVAKVSTLLSFERISELRRFGRERGGQWQPWTLSIHDGLERCQSPLLHLQAAFVEAWQELAERSTAGVAVQTTNIGQVKVPAEFASEVPT